MGHGEMQLAAGRPGDGERRGNGEGVGSRSSEIRIAKLTNRLECLSSMSLGLLHSRRQQDLFKFSIRNPKSEIVWPLAPQTRNA